MDGIISDIERIMTIKDGWCDGRGFRPTTAAVELFNGIAASNVLIGAAPTEEGGIDIEFNDSSSGVIEPDGSFTLCYSPSSKGPISLHLFDAPVDVSELLAEVHK